MMLPLYLLAAHLVGDFVLQTRWQAAKKLVDWGYRLQHVAGYCLPFLPVLYVTHPGAWKAGAFLGLLFALHFATDSRRFHSTIGDWIAWRLTSRVETIAVADPGLFYRRDKITLLDKTATVVGHRSNPGETFAPYLDVRFDLEPNPWSSIPIMIDQTLHVVQLAVLGGLFLT